jgi:branched-chain amino acid transport system permease protein
MRWRRWWPDLRRRLLRHAGRGLVLAVLLGYVLEWAFFSYLYEREHLQQVLMTYGLILVFEELRSLLVGDDVHGVAAPDWLAGTIALGG